MIKENIKEIYDALSILLVFVTVIFDLKYSKVSEVLAKPRARTKEKIKDQIKELKKMLLEEWLIVTVIFSVICYIMSPMAIDIVCNYDIKIFDFDIALTVYMVIFVIVTYFTAYVIWIEVRLIKKIYECWVEKKRIH